MAARGCFMAWPGSRGRGVLHLGKGRCVISTKPYGLVRDHLISLREAWYGRTALHQPKFDRLRDVRSVLPGYAAEGGSGLLAGMCSAGPASSICPDGEDLPHHQQFRSSSSSTRLISQWMSSTSRRWGKLCKAYQCLISANLSTRPPSPGECWPAACALTPKEGCHWYRWLVTH